MCSSILIVASCSLFFCLCLHNVDANTLAPYPNTTALLDECNMLETSKFMLDHTCIKQSRAAQTAIHQLTAPTLEACKKVCCEWSEGPCDLIYWNNLQQCFIMNYYVLSLCPLFSPTTQQSSSSFTLLLSVSQRVNSQLRKHLLRKGYRNELQSRLGCSEDEFVCDNWDCVPAKHVCDGKPHCSDNSDENACSKCLGSDGQYVAIGKQYIPHDQSDKCKVCICGKNSSAVYCYSATCYLKQVRDCFSPNRDICCQCQSKQNFKDLVTPPSAADVPFANLSDTQRLIVSCMSVLVIITLLLFLSRNILHRGRRAIYHNHTYFSRSHTRRNQPTATGRYCRESDTVSFFDPDGLRGPPLTDQPPSYNQLKPLGYDVTSNSNETLGAPPSYRSENVSNDNSMNNIFELDQGLTTSASTESPSSIESQLTSMGDCAPVSPLSTTSDSPLLSATQPSATDPH